MREILFRGKRLDNGEWVEGAFLNDRDGSFYICPAASDITYGDNGNRRRIGCWFKVDPSTVGQYTGLTDKNGKRIFEWDVVRIIERGMIADGGVVFFENGYPGGWLVGDKEFKHKCSLAMRVDVEVFGNVYDNPELAV